MLFRSCGLKVTHEVKFVKTERTLFRVTPCMIKQLQKYISTRKNIESSKDIAAVQGLFSCGE